MNGDGTPDIVVLGEDGAVDAALPGARATDWSTAQIAPAGGQLLRRNLLLADFDNNGSIDILAGDGRMLLGDGKKYSEIKISLRTSDQLRRPI